MMDGQMMTERQCEFLNKETQTRLQCAAAVYTLIKLCYCWVVAVVFAIMWLTSIILLT